MPNSTVDERSFAGYHCDLPPRISSPPAAGMTIRQLVSRKKTAHDPAHASPGDPGATRGLAKRSQPFPKTHPGREAGPQSQESPRDRPAPETRVDPARAPPRAGKTPFIAGEPAMKNFR